MSDDKIKMVELLAIFDSDSKSLWYELSEKQQSDVSKDFFILTRWMSMVKSGRRDIIEHYVLATNEFYNKHWPILYKHKKLMWDLLCMCSFETKQIFKHEWSFPKKRTSDGGDKILKFLEVVYPSTKMKDLELMASMMSKTEAIELARSYCIDESKISTMF